MKKSKTKWWDKNGSLEPASCSRDGCRAAALSCPTAFDASRLASFLTDGCVSPPSLPSAGRHGKGGTFPRQFQLPNRSKDYGDRKEAAAAADTHSHSLTLARLAHILQQQPPHIPFLPASEIKDFKAVFQIHVPSVLGVLARLLRAAAAAGNCLLRG